MIYELRTYELKVSMVNTWIKRFADALPVREKYSKLLGFWTTDISSPLNQVVHLWGYEDLKARTEARAAAAKDPAGVWPPKGDDAVVTQESVIITPAPFMRPLDGTPQELGGVYELRYYDYEVHKIPEVYKIWAGMIDAREKLSPLVLCGESEIGGLNRFYHLWPYKDPNERARIRRDAVAQGIWPPPTSQWVQHQNNKLMVPAAFSPLH